MSNITRSGAEAGAVWGTGSVGLSPGPMRRLRALVAKALPHVRPGQGKQTTMLIMTSRKGRAMEPGRIVAAQVAQAWAEAVWMAEMPLGIMTTVLRKSMQDLRGAASPWNRAYSPAHVLILTLRSIGWQVISATEFRDARKTHWDLLTVSPACLGQLVQRDAAASLTPGYWPETPAGVGPNWTAFDAALSTKGDQWTDHHRRAATGIAAGAGHCTQERLHKWGMAETAVCTLCKDHIGTLFHRRYECAGWAELRRQHVDDPLLEAAGLAEKAGWWGGFFKGHSTLTLGPGPEARVVPW